MVILYLPFPIESFPGEISISGMISKQLNFHIKLTIIALV